MEIFPIDRKRRKPRKIENSQSSIENSILPEDNVEHDSTVFAYLQQIQEFLVNHKFKGASIDQINNMERDFQIQIPKNFRELLLFTNGTPHSCGFTSYVHVSSVEDIKKLFNLREHFPEMFRKTKCIPIGKVDYDRCFDVLDTVSGAIVQLDFECDDYRVLAESLEEALQKYITALHQSMEQNDAIPREFDRDVIDSQPLQEFSEQLYQCWLPYFKNSAAQKPHLPSVVPKVESKSDSMH